MTNEYIEVPIDVEVSGYSRGTCSGIAYYDKATGELVDWDYDSDTYDMVRNDMDADVDIPLKVDVDV